MIQRLSHFSCLPVLDCAEVVTKGALLTTATLAICIFTLETEDSIEMRENSFRITVLLTCGIISYKCLRLINQLRRLSFPPPINYDILSRV